MEWGGRDEKKKSNKHIKCGMQCNAMREKRGGDIPPRGRKGGQRSSTNQYLTRV